MPVHSYGKCLNNRPWAEAAGGRAAKHRLIAGYKFTLAFENSVSPDYVTEKFFDPLMVGSVPVYLGSSSVRDFAPGDHCYIDVSRFSAPKQLAEYLLRLNDDDEAYRDYLVWKEKPLRREFLDLLAGTEEHPIIRLARLVQTLPSSAGAPQAASRLF